MNTVERVIRNVQGMLILAGVVVCAMIFATAWSIGHSHAQFPAPAHEPPITWDAATDTLTITRGDVMVCLPQAAKPPACRFAKWWTETEIR